MGRPSMLLDRIKYAPFHVQLVVTRRCNLECGYCNEFDQVSKPVPTEVLKARLDKLMALGTLSVQFTGGEPMLHPEIYELIRYARALGFRLVQMISNAYLFNEAKVRKLNEAGLQRLQISVDGVKPNDVTVKVLDPMRKKLLTVARVAEFEVVLSGVIGSAPSDEVLEVIDFAKEHGFKPRVLLIHGEDGQLLLTEEQLALYGRVRVAMGQRFRDSGDYRTRLAETGEAPFKCRAGSRYLYIDEFGVVRWCSQQIPAFGIPLADYTPEDLRRQFHTPKGCSSKCTVGCVRTDSAPDQWRPQDPAMGEAGEPGWLQTNAVKIPAAVNRVLAAVRPRS
ncbi:MAG: radical SAM protein [Myxococcota bacterium]